MKLLSVKNFTLAAGLLSGMPLLAAEKATVTPLFSNVADSVTIPAEIYGQFAEHLGTCIYGGLWVGENSPIPNTSGYRNDVLNALKELKVPVMRWPGGCFADEYHWTDGIGPKENRPVMVNTNWGGTVEELAKWVEYITAENGPMADQRKKNGREKPWKLKYLGVGNESW